MFCYMSSTGKNSGKFSTTSPNREIHCILFQTRQGTLWSLHSHLFLELKTGNMAALEWSHFYSHSYNLGHNILELYNVLMQIRLNTIKTKRNIYYNKLGIRVAFWVAEWLKT